MRRVLIKITIVRIELSHQAKINTSQEFFLSPLEYAISALMIRQKGLENAKLFLNEFTRKMKLSIK